MGDQGEGSGMTTIFDGVDGRNAHGGLHRSPAALEAAVGAGAATLRPGEPVSDVLLASAGDASAALRLAALPWMYRRRGLDEQLRIYAMQLALKEAQQRAKLWPRCPVGEKPLLIVFEDGRPPELRLPVHVRGAKQRPVAIPSAYPAELATPWEPLKNGAIASLRRRDGRT
jgi:hypothetical protein